MAASERRKTIRIILLVFWLAVMGWLYWNMQARGFDPTMLQSDSAVSVSRGPRAIEFRPIPDTSGTGLVFFPGALVDPDAYAPMARAIAEAGYRVSIMFLPYRVAPLQAHRDDLFERALYVIGGDRGTRRWVVGGHSRGGALSAEFAARHESDIDGLLLVGTTHPRESDLSSLQVDVMKIYGTEDGLASPDDIRRNRGYLPQETEWVAIEGGNHAQFAWYGWQLGDGRAKITRKEQQATLLQAILEQLGRIADRPR